MVTNAISSINFNPSKYDIYPQGGDTFGESKVELPPVPKTFWGTLKAPFQYNSEVVIASHFIKSVFGPTILAMPHAFMNGGYLFGSIAFFTILALIYYNMMRLVKSAIYLSQREEIEVKTYDELAFYSFSTCSDTTRGYAAPLRVFINILFIVTRMDACCIFLIFCSRNLDVFISFYFPNNSFNVRTILFLIMILVLFMNSIRQLKYLTPFSLFATIGLWTVVILALDLFICRDLPPLSERNDITPISNIFRFNSIVLFSQSGVAVTLTLRSSMAKPQNFPGVYLFTMIFIMATYWVFGFCGYWKFGENTFPSIMLNLPITKPAARVIKVMTIFSIFCSLPIVFYISFNVYWNNYVKRKILEDNRIFAEYFVRYLLTAILFLVAFAIPDLGGMIVLKGALLHSQLEIMYPAILDFVTFFPEKGVGQCYFRLFRLLFFITYGIVSVVGGSIIGVEDIIQRYQAF